MPNPPPMGDRAQQGSADGLPSNAGIRGDRASEVAAWAAAFGVTPAAIRRAVERVGSDAEAVRRELGGQSRHPGLSPAAGLAQGVVQATEEQLLEDGQEEVFARAEFLTGAIEHHVGEEAARPLSVSTSRPSTDA